MLCPPCYLSYDFESPAPSEILSKKKWLVDSVSIENIEFKTIYPKLQ